MNKIHKEVYLYIRSIDRIKYKQSYIIIESNNNEYIYMDSIPLNVLNYIKDNNIYFYKKINKENSFFLAKKEDGELLQNLINIYKNSIEESEYNNLYNTIYKKMANEYNSSFDYFFKMQDILEEQIVFNNNEYQLLLNMSNIYHLLSIGRFFLEEWYNKHNNSYKKVLCVKELSNNKSQNDYVIRIDSLKKDNIVFAIANYYQEYFKKNIEKELDLFISELKVDKNEQLLLLSLISIPKKEVIDDKEKLLQYLSITIGIVSKKYKEYHEYKEEMLEE